MADYKDRLGGGALATYSQVTLPAATSVVVVPSYGYRVAVRLANVGANTPYLGYGGVATSTRGHPVPSIGFIEENYLGEIQAAVPSGASSAIAFAEVRST